MRWRACQFKFIFPRPALVMGVLNVTPDSFSDGGRFSETEAAVVRARQLIEQGCDILDIGGESTRPGAAIVDEAEELRRVIPVIEQLSKSISVPISIDTSKPAVARVAITAGASIVNDIAAARADSEMRRLVAESGVGYICMHMQGTPQTMQAAPHYDSIVDEVEAFFVSQIASLESSGIHTEQIVLDVGIGFGKTLTHNLDLLAALRRFTVLGRPVLLGASRKSFIAQIAGAPTDSRLAGGLASASWAVSQKVNIIRTHDVTETVQALRIIEAITGRD